MPPPDPAFLERAWFAIAAAAVKADVAVVRGTERRDGGRLLATALVIDREGTMAGFQDKVQLDPSEEGTYSFGSGRRVFRSGPLTFGVAICHEGWRYPETVGNLAAAPVHEACPEGRNGDGMEWRDPPFIGTLLMRQAWMFTVPDASPPSSSCS